VSERDICVSWLSLSVSWLFLGISWFLLGLCWLLLSASWASLGPSWFYIVSLRKKNNRREIVYIEEDILRAVRAADFAVSHERCCWHEICGFMCVT